MRLSFCFPMYTLYAVRNLLKWVRGQASFCRLWYPRQGVSADLPCGPLHGEAVEAWGNLPALLRNTNPDPRPRLLCRGMAWVDDKWGGFGSPRRVDRQPKRRAH